MAFSEAYTPSVTYETHYHMLILIENEPLEPQSATGQLLFFLFFVFCFKKRIHILSMCNICLITSWLVE